MRSLDHSESYDSSSRAASISVLILRLHSRDRSIDRAEAALAGCIPVLLADGVELPYEQSALKGVYDEARLSNILKIPSREGKRVHL